MNSRTIHIILMAMMLLCLVTDYKAVATDHAIFVDGSLDPDNPSDPEGLTGMDRLQEKAIRRAMSKFKKLNEHDPEYVNTKEDLLQLLTPPQGINCGCGDTLSLFLVGHGCEDNFCFSKETDEDKKWLTADELSDWLGQVLNCNEQDCDEGDCCKIHVVIDTCHSASFMDNLLENEHVESVYTAAGPNETSYFKTFYDAQGQMEMSGWWVNFVQDYDEVAEDKDIADQLEEASKSAEYKLGLDVPPDQHPEGWRRGKQRVIAHVEKVIESNGSDGNIREMTVTFIYPPFMRGKAETVKVVPEPDWLLQPDDLKYCDWIECRADINDYNADPPGRVTIEDPINIDSPPLENIVAHVEEVFPAFTPDNRVATIRVHVIEPRWMYCKDWIIYPRDPWPQVEYCNYIDETIEIIKLPSEEDSNSPGAAWTLTSDRIEPCDDKRFWAKAHIDARDASGAWTRLHALEPPFLHCKSRWVNTPADGLLKELGDCNNVWVLATMRADRNWDIDPNSVYKARKLSRGDHYYIFDGAIDSILEPDFSISSDSTTDPSVRIRNVGMEALDSGEVHCVIKQSRSEPIYSNKQDMPPLAYGESVVIVFDSFPALKPGNYHIEFELFSDEDLNTRNNRLKQIITVREN